MDMLRLRIELGQSQQAVVDRAQASGQVRETFTRIVIWRAELQPPKKPIGLGSYQVRLGLSIGLGLTMEDLDAYLSGRATLEQTIKRSSIKPDPREVERLKGAESQRTPWTQKVIGSELAPRLPNLADALVWARGQIPEEFLRHFEEEARRFEEDRPKPAWWRAINDGFREWKRTPQSKRAGFLKARRRAG